MEEMAQEIYSSFRKEVLGETDADTLPVKSRGFRGMNSAGALSPGCISEG